MTVVDEIIEFNSKFVETRDYEAYLTTKYPDKKVVILSCMDTRLTGLLPAALNFKNGDIKLIKNAGAVVTHAFGSVMRSLIIAVYELGVEEIMVIGHDDCGMQGLNSKSLIDKMIKRDISKDKIDMISRCGINLEEWFRGFDDVEASVKDTVTTISEHPLIPSDIMISGFLINPNTGKLKTIIRLASVV